ncbi:MAG TPA: DUF1361 domain-containing protein [Puia sp.]|nr:DUF1361 domain-containing protein [Puia sp.]
MISYPLSVERTWRRWFLRSETDRLLTCSMCFSCGLVVLRMIHAHSLLFVFMIWNLFLAYVPYVLSCWLTGRFEGRASWSPQRLAGGTSCQSPRLGRPLAKSLSSPIRSRPLFIVAVCLVWLLFFPNAFYMLTDLFHLHDSRNPRVPEWFDLAMIFSFAWNGLVLGVLSLRQMEKLLETKRLATAIFGRRLRVPLPYPTAIFIYPVIGLSALGVYTGRYLRYNSWDIVSNPFQLMEDISGMIIHPLRNRPAWDMILCYAILLSFVYIMLKKLSRALA